MIHFFVIGTGIAVKADLIPLIKSTKITDIYGLNLLLLLLIINCKLTLNKF